MKHLSVLIKPASSLCNSRCKYCFYADVSNLREIKSFGIMKEDIMVRLIDNIYKDLESEDHITFAFQGGEPTVAGIEFFENFTKYVKEKNPKVIVHYALQTNGTLIDEKWCNFLKENNFLVGLSLDGGASFHNENRLDENKKGTFSKVMKTKRLSDKYKVEYNILCVLTNENARYPKQIFKFILEEKIKYIQFIPCLDELESSNQSDYALKPERFASFYKQLYRMWEIEFKKGNYISVGLFDNIANLLSRGIIGGCGMIGNCQVQYVIEADGSVYPCDFYVLDQYKIGNIAEGTLKEMFEHDISKKFLQEKRELGEICNSCEFIKMCNGGCKRMKNSMYLNKDGNYCGYKDFLSLAAKPLSGIVSEKPY